MKWVLYDFKSAKEAWFEVAESVYLKKINHYEKFDIQHLKTLKSDRENAAIKLKFEEQQLLKKLTSDDFVILFDEKGRNYDSAAFSEIINKVSGSGKKRGVVIIGGAFGVSDAVKKKANVTVSLSVMVMNHLIAEAVVLEQFYRAQTIINRIPYHNA